MNEIDTVGALIITYNPDINLLKNNINSIFSQVNKIIIVDNASKNIGIIESEFGELVNVIKNQSNYGIAKALNIGMENFKFLGYKWVLTLDQDSVCPDNLMAEFKNKMADERVGIICPDVYYVGKQNTNQVNNRERFIKIDACMTSASLTRIDAWEFSGKFNDFYFIDFVDNDFCMKLKLNGYIIFRANKVLIHHCLGEAKVVKIFNKKYVKFLHSPFRTFYMVRNNILFIKQYKENLNVMKEIIKLLYIVMNILLFSDYRYRHIKNIVAGIKAAI